MVAISGTDLVVIVDAYGSIGTDLVVIEVIYGCAH